MIDFPNDKQLILFDGVCNLCNNSVQYVIKRDKKNLFMFAPLQSETGKSIIETYAIDTANTDSILLYVPGKGIYTRSSAALRIASKLTFPTNVLTIFRIVPSFISNLVYNFIAKNRYKWYGKRAHCMIPTPQLKDKFLQ